MNQTLLDLKGGIPQSHKWQPRTALEAFRGLTPGPRHKEILSLCLRQNQPLTDRQIKDLLGFEDMNSVRPRISELIDFKYLTVCGYVICPKTKEKVRQIKVIQKGNQLEMF